MPRAPAATLLLASILATLPWPGAAARAFHEPSLALGSGNVTGAYYVASSAVAKIFNRRSADYGIRLTTLESEGSPANIQGVLQGRLAFGIAQADVLQHAAAGLGAWEGLPREGLRAVLGLHVEAVTIVAAGDRGIEELADLRGRRVNIGAPGSSDHQQAAVLLEAGGVPAGVVTLFERSAVRASELLQSDEIDAYIYTVGHPNLSLLEASSGRRKVRLVPLDERVIARLTAASPPLFHAVIPTGHYPGLAPQGAVPTVGVRAVLFTRADMAEETVYRVAREVLRNSALFQRQHPVLQEVAPRQACGITAIPYHPGAARACREHRLAP
jgi:TRAP transporter TAXI family solute receptor